MQDYEDSEGQSLGEDGAAAHRVALAHIEGELARCASPTLRRDLERERAHLVRELAAGLYLPVDNEAEPAGGRRGGIR